ncbi:unnamed protein product [Pleuronectes platessa]|uniref:Uncharacterized protein n=1 Tax=Pleuronectes platessa TaxID=8262 RepID=A0A9N7UCA2_PLEPL|nr:unnamed protein product [Pleuronectes platessa]
MGEGREERGSGQMEGVREEGEGKGEEGVQLEVYRVHPDPGVDPEPAEGLHIPSALGTPQNPPGRGGQRGRGTSGKRYLGGNHCDLSPD